jgi:zinc D-Ala-D-Ala carboxypeptidase
MTLRYFHREDFDCAETGENEIKGSFLLLIDELRHRCGFPFIVNSGYRDPLHSAEASKPTPGTHTSGIAADIRVSGGKQRGKIVEEAIAMGFKGIGVAKTFVHVDTRDVDDLTMWSY